MNCRLCLNNLNQISLQCIFDSMMDWSIWIHKYLLLKIEPDDAYSIFICQTCSKHLKEFHNFFQSVHESQATLKTSVNLMGLKDENSLLKEQTDKQFPGHVDNDSFQVVNPTDATVVGQWNVDVAQFKMEFLVTEIEEPEQNSSFHGDTLEKPVAHSGNCVKSTSTSNPSNDIDEETLPVNFEISGNRTDLKTTKPKAKLRSDNGSAKRSTPIKCPLCEWLCRNKKSLYNHMYKYHKDTEKHPCISCERRFVNRAMYEMHLKLHTRCMFENDLSAEEHLTCTICGQTFNTFKTLKTHMQGYHESFKLFTCEFCGLRFSLRCELGFHLKNCKLLPMTPKIIETNIPIKTDISEMLDENLAEDEFCNKIFDSKIDLSSHVELNHTANIEMQQVEYWSRCEEDGQKTETCNFQSTIETSKEQKKRESTKKFQCKGCGLAFVSRIRLKTHLKNNVFCKKAMTRVKKHAANPITCPLCEWLCKNKKSLYNHMYKYHKDTKKHPCISCGRSFVNRAMYETHLKLHQRCMFEKDLIAKEHRTCVVCSQFFSSFTLLKVHMRKNHKHVQPFICEFCSLRFPLRFQLDFHFQTSKNCTGLQSKIQIQTQEQQRDENKSEIIESILPDKNYQKDNVCNICNEMLISHFANEDDLNNHISMYHTIKLEQQLLENSKNCESYHRMVGTEHKSELMNNKNSNRLSEMNLRTKKTTKQDKGKKFYCTNCDLVFITRVKLKSHLKTNKNCMIANRKEDPKKAPKKNVTSIICPICKLVCRNKKGLYNHMYGYHKDNEKHPCFSCGRSFVNQAMYEAHLKQNKRCTFENELNTEEHLTCTVCCQIFKTIRLLKLHMGSDHESFRPFICEICGHRFQLHFQLDFHIKNKDNCLVPVHKFSCYICGKGFKFKKDIAVHIRNDNCAKSFQVNEKFSMKDDESNKFTVEFKEENPIEIIGIMDERNLNYNADVDGQTKSA